MLNSTERFSSRVENYVRYRPHYPQAVAECLRQRCGLTSASLIADIGSGTGILTELLLQNGNAVYAIEPNRAMREAGEHLLQHYEDLTSLAATAEATTLPDQSVDLVTAGQAFHWFDPQKAKAEFKRILKPQGWVALIWNERLEASTPFAQDYGHLLQTFAPDYEQVNHKKRADDAALQKFFYQNLGHDRFDNAQHLDFEGLKGRLLSSSYAPEIGHRQHAPMLEELRRIFDAHQTNGTIAFEYDTNVYYGQLM